MRLPSLVVTTTIRLGAHRRQHPPRKTVRRNSRCKFPSRSIPRVVGKPEVIARHGAVIDVFQHGNDSDLRPGRYALRFPSLRHSGLRVFCFIGSALNNTGFPPIKQTLACDSKPPRSLSCPKENGAERKVKTKCLIYMLSGLASGVVCSPTAAPLKHVWGSLATPGTEACDAVGGALRPQRREWPVRKIFRV